MVCGVGRREWVPVVNIVRTLILDSVWDVGVLGQRCEVVDEGGVRPALRRLTGAAKLDCRVVDLGVALLKPLLQELIEIIGVMLAVEVPTFRLAPVVLRSSASSQASHASV